MKKIIIIVILFSIFIIGCSDSTSTIQSATKKTIELPDKARVINDLMTIRNAVNEYYADNLKYPETLEKLDLNIYFPIEDFIYNMNTGIVKNKYYKNL